jgi:hypothetical protein
MIVTFTRSTKERRAELLAIKQMIDEAHRFREDRNLGAYANLVADIELARIKINPAKIHKISQAEKTAAFYRSYGRLPKSASSNELKHRWAFFDETLSYQSVLLLSFEKILRIGFEWELLGDAALKSKFTKWT